MSKPKFWVVCPDYVSGPHGSREIAQRQIDAGSCYNDHEIVESAVKPVAANSAWSEDDDQD